MLIQAPTRVYRNWVSDSRRWEAYLPRHGDIVIATYPKSGTTWMQQIVSLLIFQSIEPRPIADIAPWLDRRARGEPAEAVMAYLDTQSHRRFIKSHVPLDGMPIYDEVQYIHVARDGRDACLSYHNHCRAFGKAMLAAMDDIGRYDETLSRPYPRAPKDPRDFYRKWLREGVNDEPDGLPFGSWFHFEQTYWAARSWPNFLLVHYRDLKADLQGEMRRIAGFLDISVPDATWPSLVAAATFESMRRNGDLLHPVIARNLNGGTTTFFDRGENDRWRGVLSDDDIADFEHRCRSVLEPACRTWLEHGRLQALAGMKQHAAN